LEQQHRQDTAFDVAGFERAAGSCKINVQDFGSNSRGDIKIGGEVPGLAEEIGEGFGKGDGEV